MHIDLKDSIKARLYDMKYTPFLASYVFFWIYFNAKQILIFTTGKLSINDKIDMLSYSDIDIINPLFYALAYTIIFPIFTAGFYYITLQYRRLMNKIKQKIEDVTPLPQIEANEIKAENADLRIELDEKIDELSKAKFRFETKEKSLIAEYDIKTKELESSYADKLDADTKDLNAELHKANTSIVDKNTEIAEKDKRINDIIDKQKQKIDALTTKIKVFEDKEEKKANFGLDSTLKEVKLSNKTMIGTIKENIENDKKNLMSNLSDDEKAVLKTIYEDDIALASSDNYINKLIKPDGFKRVKIQALLASLVSKNILNYSHNNYDTTEKGRKIILELFEK